MVNIALRLKRQAKGLTQGELGSAVGVSLQNYSKMERGHVRISALVAVRIARVLGCTVEDITPDEGGKSA